MNLLSLFKYIYPNSSKNKKLINILFYVPRQKYNEYKRKSQPVS